MQHWVARARMSLQMVEQLDLAGRTGEMVRTRILTLHDMSCSQHLLRQADAHRLQLQRDTEC